METLYYCKKKHKVDSEKERRGSFESCFSFRKIQETFSERERPFWKAAALKRSSLNGFYCYRILLCSSCLAIILIQEGSLTLQSKKKVLGQKKDHETPNTPYFAICFDVRISRGPLCLILLCSLDPRVLATQNPTANDPHFHHEWKFPWGAIIWDYEFDYYYI